MSEIKHTPGPYLRTGSTIYALQHAGWSKGEEQFCNRIYASVQRGPDCSQGEAEAVARLFQAAPDLFDACRELVEACDHGSPVELMALIGMACEVAREALAKATGTQP
jgi:hypothetical protein